MQKRSLWSRQTAAQALTGRPRGFPATGRTPLWGRAPQRGQGGAVVTGSDGAGHGTRTPGFCETRILVRAPRSCLGRTPGSGVSAPREKRGGRWRDVLGESPPAATAQHRVLAPRFCGDRARPRQAGRPAQRLSRWSCVCAGLWPEGSLRAAAARTGSG